MDLITIDRHIHATCFRIFATPLESLRFRYRRHIEDSPTSINRNLPGKNSEFSKQFPCLETQYE